jgi:hypothetical protein
MQVTRFGKVSPQCVRARQLSAEKVERPGNEAAPAACEARAGQSRRGALQGLLASLCASRRTASQAPRACASQLWAQPPSEGMRASANPSRRLGTQDLGRGPALLRGSPSCGSIQVMVAALAHSSRMPNPSVNLTRNSAPHWPGKAHCVHSALPGQCGTLSHAGYLKR